MYLQAHLKAPLAQSQTKLLKELAKIIILAFNKFFATFSALEQITALAITDKASCGLFQTQHEAALH
jgi:hypothetical protein